MDGSDFASAIAFGAHGTWGQGSVGQGYSAHAPMWEPVAPDSCLPACVCRCAVGPAVYQVRGRHGVYRRAQRTQVRGGRLVLVVVVVVVVVVARLVVESLCVPAEASLMQSSSGTLS